MGSSLSFWESCSSSVSKLTWLEEPALCSLLGNTLIEELCLLSWIKVFSWWVVCSRNCSWFLQLDSIITKTVYTVFFVQIFLKPKLLWGHRGSWDPPWVAAWVYSSHFLWCSFLNSLSHMSPWDCGTSRHVVQGHGYLSSKLSTIF